MSDDLASNAEAAPSSKPRRPRFKPVPPPSMEHAVASLGVSFVAAALFLWLASQVLVSDHLVAMDAAAFEIAQSIQTPALTAIVSWITTIGNTSTLTVLSIAVGVWLAKIGSRRRLIAFASTMALGGMLNSLLKYSAQRPRPGVFEHLVRASGFSFPSGHSMGSMLFFGSMAYVFAMSLEAHRALRMAAVAGSLMCAVLIGLSRVYLGVHFLTDVLGGFTAGICWIGICIAATEMWTARRQPKRATDLTD